jgi:hypothetical protein
MNETSVANRTFATVDQQAFAILSGDHNPMHMDDVEARRTQAGACVVHGVHLLLWSLEKLARKEYSVARLVHAKIKFVGFVHLNLPVELHVLKADDTTLRFQLMAEETSVLTATLSFGETRQSDRRAPPTERVVVELGIVPREIEFEIMAQQVGRLELLDQSREMAQRLFPTLCELVNVDTVCELASLSAVVGMITPGLHSIFSEVVVSFHAPDDLAAGVNFQGKRADARFRKVELLAEGSRLTAEITAFARMPPTTTPSMESISISIVPGEFRNRRALVIGGSRGIGATAAKAIAAGGGTVVLSYADGRAEAEAVQADIARSCGPTSSTLFQYRVGSDPSAQLAGLETPFTHVYYFPTPRIFGQRKSTYSQGKFVTFAGIYIDGFYDLAMALLASHSPKALALFYPSSVAVTERPKGMTEYSMAKAAGEVLCADLLRSFPGLAISVPRLPRIQTDQTATVPPVPAAEALDIMLPLLRRERSAVT